MSDQETTKDIPEFKINDEPDDKSLITEDSVVRVEEKLTFHWTGVRSCCDADRIKNEVHGRFFAWLEGQKAARPDHTLFNYGLGAGRVTCRSSGGGGSARRCSATTTPLPAFAEFYKNS